MQLTASLLRQLVDLPVEVEPVAGGSDKRRSGRLKMELQATILPFSERISTQNLMIAVRDISRGGVSFVCKHRLPLGEQFGLVLPENDAQPVVILCTIAYWQPLTSGDFAIGARFCRVLRSNDAGMSLLLEDAISGAITDCRVAS